jgi:hypothetical protein
VEVLLLSVLLLLSSVVCCWVAVTTTTGFEVGVTWDVTGSMILDTILPPPVLVAAVLHYQLERLKKKIYFRHTLLVLAHDG